MKLPENKKERMLIYALIGVVGIVILAVAILWGILPLLDSRREMESSLVELDDKLKKADRELGYAPAFQREYDDMLAELERIRAENVLRPILGSYLVGVTEQIEATARQAGVRTEEVREVGMVSIPRKGQAAGSQVFMSFVVQVGGEGSFEAIARFIKQMEDRNPFFSVSEFSITGQSVSPELQRFSVRMVWPIEPAAKGERKEGV